MGLKEGFTHCPPKLTLRPPLPYLLIGKERCKPPLLGEGVKSMRVKEWLGRRLEGLGKTFLGIWGDKSTGGPIPLPPGTQF